MSPVRFLILVLVIITLALVWFALEFDIPALSMLKAVGAFIILGFLLCSGVIFAALSDRR